MSKKSTKPNPISTPEEKRTFFSAAFARLNQAQTDKKAKAVFDESFRLACRLDLINNELALKPLKPFIRKRLEAEKNAIHHHFTHPKKRKAIKTWQAPLAKEAMALKHANPGMAAEEIFRQSQVLVDVKISFRTSLKFLRSHGFKVQKKSTKE